MLALQQWIARVALNIAISFVQSTAEAADSYSVHFLKNFLRSFFLKSAIVGQFLQALPLRSYRLQHFFFGLMHAPSIRGPFRPACRELLTDPLALAFQNVLFAQRQQRDSS
jgi:hypothetical protein